MAMLILPALAILAIVLGGQSKKHIKCSEGTLTGSGCGVNPIGWTVTGLKLECPPGWLN